MSIMENTWRKIENELGFPFYLNEKTSVRQWDHPQFCGIKQRLDDCNYIKYSVYRVATKFRVLQQMLHMDDVPLIIVTGVFERHRLGSTEGSLCMENCDLEAVLSDIYFASNKQNHTNTDIDFATELMVNFLYNIYDRERLGKTQVFCAKLILAILSKCKLEDLYRFIFQLCADHNNCITRVRLQMLLTRITEVTAFLHEDINFGDHLIHSSIDICFSNCPGLVGVNESVLIAWFNSNPALLNWIPTLFRLKAAENVIHLSKCAVCKASPLAGLRYRCLKCYHYNLCQHCFFSVQISHNHKNNHPMREYCSESVSREFPQAVLKKLCNLTFCSRKRNSGTNYIEPNTLSTNREWLPMETMEPNDLMYNITPLSSPQSQLQVIIRQLEIQNQEFQQQMGVFGKQNYNEIDKYLEEHRQHIATQIQKLKVLKDYLKKDKQDIVKPTTGSSRKNRLESTPMVTAVRGSRRTAREAAATLFSPIATVPEFTVIPETESYTTNSDTTISCATTQNHASYSCRDISTWLGGRTDASKDNIYVTEGHQQQVNQHSMNIAPVREMQNDLDSVLDKLQQILANNFTLEESLRASDNGQLKNVVTEMEGMLSSLIDNVETSRSNSTEFRTRETSLL